MSNSSFLRGGRSLALATLAAVIAALPGGAAGSGPIKHASSMTVVPPAAVTQHVEVEARVALRNNTPEKSKYRVVVEVRSGDVVKPIYDQEVEVAALDQELVSTRFATADLVGEGVVHSSVTPVGGVATEHERPLTVIESDSRAVPLLQLGWLEPGAYSIAGYLHSAPPNEAYLRAAIDEYHRIGVRGFLIAYPESIYSGAGVYYPSKALREFEPRCDFDVVGAILNQASKNGQHVFVGLGRGADLHLTWTGFDDPARNESAITHSMKVATELWALYGHEPSFYGWYLSHEANEIERASKSYYNPVTRFLRTFEADKPVLISPSGTPVVSRDALRSSEVDIVAYQDAVGSGYVPFENTFDPQRRIAGLEKAYAEYSAAHRDSGKHLWANLEVWQMDGPTYADAYPAGIDRVKRQLKIAQEHVDVVTAYALGGMMEPPGTKVRLGGERAVQLFEGYRDYFHHAGSLQAVR